jgi:hypothetical protein
VAGQGNGQAGQVACVVIDKQYFHPWALCTREYITQTTAAMIIISNIINGIKPFWFLIILVSILTLMSTPHQYLKLHNLITDYSAQVLVRGK